MFRKHSEEYNNYIKEKLSLFDIIIEWLYNNDREIEVWRIDFLNYDGLLDLHTEYHRTIIPIPTKKWLDFCSALTVNTSLTTLILSGLRFDALKLQEWKYFCTALRLNTGIKNLELDKVNLGSLGDKLPYLLEALSKNRSITKISLQNSDLRVPCRDSNGLLKYKEYDSKQFFDALLQNNTITELDISESLDRQQDVKSDLEFVTKLGNFIEHQKSLKTLRPHFVRMIENEQAIYEDGEWNIVNSFILILKNSLRKNKNITTIQFGNVHLPHSIYGYDYIERCVLIPKRERLKQEERHSALLPAAHCLTQYKWSAKSQFASLPNRLTKHVLSFLDNEPKATQLINQVIGEIETHIQKKQALKDAQNAQNAQLKLAQDLIKDKDKEKKNEKEKDKDSSAEKENKNKNKNKTETSLPQWLTDPLASLGEMFEIVPDYLFGTGKALAKL